MTAIGIVAFVVALLVSVVLHEAGHFAFAKKFGMKATQFFVGFGPTIWSRQKGETEYGLKAIPAGGYVKIIGMTDLEPVELRPGQEVELEDVVARLAGAAYSRVDLVEKRGEFAVRGGIVDLFPPTAESPVRIEFWGDEVSELRCFSVADQRSLTGEGSTVDEVVAPPCRELLLTEEVRASTVTLEEAQAMVLAYVKRFVPERRTAPLCGNSIGTDRGFLARDMPELDDHLHYRMIDVSSIKELARRWFPRVYFAQPPKGLAHRAADDFRGAGYDVPEAGNYPWGKIATTTIYFRPGTLEQARAEQVAAEFCARAEPRFPGLQDASAGIIAIITDDYKGPQQGK